MFMGYCHLLQLPRLPWLCDADIDSVTGFEKKRDVNLQLLSWTFHGFICKLGDAL